jgi:hypothetical protein
LLPHRHPPPEQLVLEQLVFEQAVLEQVVLETLGDA